MLSDLLGTSSIVKVLDFVLEDWDLDFSVSDIARETGLTWKSVAETIPLLKKMNLIIESRVISRAKLFKVNRESKLFQFLNKIDLQISSLKADEYVKEESKQKVLAKAK